MQFIHNDTTGQEKTAGSGLRSFEVCASFGPCVIFLLVSPVERIESYFEYFIFVLNQRIPIPMYPLLPSA